MCSSGFAVVWCVCSSEDRELSSARSAERSVLDSDRERDDSSDARQTQRHPAAGRRNCNTDSFQDEKLHHIKKKRIRGNLKPGKLSDDNNYNNS